MEQPYRRVHGLVILSAIALIAVAALLAAHPASHGLTVGVPAVADDSDPVSTQPSAGPTASPEPSADLTPDPSATPDPSPTPGPSPTPTFSPTPDAQPPPTPEGEAGVSLSLFPAVAAPGSPASRVTGGQRAIASSKVPPGPGRSGRLQHEAREAFPGAGVLPDVAFFHPPGWLVAVGGLVALAIGLLLSAGFWAKRRLVTL